MARKRKIEEKELMTATEELLIEKGYDGFHFKALSEKLDAARSTIYEYYPHKDSLISAYMLNLMKEIREKCQDLMDIPDPMIQLKRMLDIFLSYTSLHKVIALFPRVHTFLESEDKLFSKKLDDEHERMFQLILSIIKNAQKERVIRNDLAPGVISYLFFNAIQLPFIEKIDPSQRTEVLFSLIVDGIKNQNCPN